MAETQLLGGELFALSASDWDGGRLGGSDDAQRRREYLDVAGTDVRIPHRIGTHGHLALDEHHALIRKRRRRCNSVRGRAIRIE